MSDRIAEFARLDGLIGQVKHVFNVEVQEELVEAARKAGSIDAMPEPYKSWLSASSIDDLPPEVLERNYADVLIARGELEAPPAEAEGAV